VSRAKRADRIKQVFSLSSTGYPMKGPLLGTNPAIDSEEAKVDKTMASSCRDC
jgi:hypothetical protein